MPPRFATLAAFLFLAIAGQGLGDRPTWANVANQTTETRASVRVSTNKNSKWGFRSPALPGDLPNG